MTKRLFISAATAIIACSTLIGAAGTGEASDREKAFFRTVQGQWSGPGEIVAGKYKGTKFVCNFTGATPDGKVGMSLDGGCRVGVFTQKMSASFEKGPSGYRGSFMDGSEGKGLDVVGGSVSGKKVTFALNRKQLKGAMLANMADDNTMNVTVSVKVEDELVPVIGMSLKRQDKGAVGAVASE